jgi:hypothetical protein
MAHGGFPTRHRRKTLTLRKIEQKMNLSEAILKKRLLTMWMKPQRIKFLLAMGISFLLAAYPAYLQYNSFIEIDFLSTHPSFENLDQENLLADEQNKVKTFVVNSSPELFLLGIFSAEPFPPHSFQVLSPRQPASILRC